MKEKLYNRDLAVKYAHKWAYSRNPKYYNFDRVGGDCTSFISQCIYAGSGIMNYSYENGWYYKSGYDKSPSWSGVEFLYKFITTNSGVGPFGINTDKTNIDIGDFIQLSFDGINFEHSVVIVNIDKENIYTASHTIDSDNRNINTYKYKNIRFIHLEKVRIY